MECDRCLSNQTIKSINLDKNNICQFCNIHDEMNEEFPLNDLSEKKLFKISEKIKKDGINSNYDCIVGISGGRDSTFLLYYIKKVLNLRPLAVHYDNGFDSDTSVSNILNICQKLNVELETNVADWKTFKKITRSFFLAGVSDPDTPTDVGIFKTMYQTAYREKIKYVFNGHSFRTEGIEPLDWTYMDGKYIEEIHKKYGDGDLSKFDNFYISDIVKYKILYGIKTILPLNYINYSHDKVEKILKEEVNWSYYGGHHHESLLTKFVVSSYLPKKFNIDRRLTSYSAMVRSGLISKNEAKKILKTKPISFDEENNLQEYILDKLDISKNKFDEIMSQERKNFRNFKTYYNLFKYFKIPIKILYKLNFIPKILYLRYFG
jgi:N-acetyl sugar amidotransferase